MSHHNIELYTPLTNLTWGSIFLIFYQIWGTKADFFLTAGGSNFQNDKKALFWHKNALFEYEKAFF